MQRFVRIHKSVFSAYSKKVINMTRDSVGDDVNPSAKSSTQMSIDMSQGLTEFLSEIVEKKNYLPNVSVGKNSWVVRDEFLPLAVIDPKKDEIKLLTNFQYIPAKLHFEYCSQMDANDKFAELIFDQTIG
jgi:hypothetical protein